MKKSYKLTFLSVAFASMTLLAACGDSSASSTTDGSQQAADPQVLKVAFNQPENHPQFKAMEEFGAQLKEKTDGAYEIELFPNELLGAQRETIELVQSGTIGMSIVAGSLLEGLNEEFAVFNLPYVFDSAEHQMSVLNDPEIVGDLYSSLEGQNISVVGAFHGGVRNVYNNTKPITKPEDLAGMKIRVIESDTNLQMMKYMGGVGTPLGQGEVYTAIQSGVLDGGENNELIYANLKHVEIAKYYSYTKHLMLPDYLIVGSSILSGMSEEHKSIFEEELEKAIDMEVQLWEEDVQTAIETAEAAGAEFNEVDVTIFQDAVQPLIDEKLSSDAARALYDKVRQAAQ